MLINRFYQIEKYKKIKGFKINSKSIQIYSSNRKNNFTINSKASSKKKKLRTSMIKKAINSTEIFAINESSLRKKRRSIVNKCLKNNLLLREYCNGIFNGSKLNNTVENVHPKNNLMSLLNKFDRDKKFKNKILNKSQKVKNIENIFNLLNKKSKNNNAMKEINNSNLKIKKRNQKSNGGNPSLSDLNENNNNNWKIVSQKKNKMLKNLILGDKQKEIINEKDLMNLDNNRGLRINQNGIKIHNN